MSLQRWYTTSQQERLASSFLENVVGLAVRHRKTLEAIITTLRNAFTPYGDSYRVQMAVLNSKDFQVPQRRSLIFIMGC